MCLSTNSTHQALLPIIHPSPIRLDDQHPCYWLQHRLVQTKSSYDYVPVMQSFYDKTCTSDKASVVWKAPMSLSFALRCPSQGLFRKFHQMRRRNFNVCRRTKGEKHWFSTIKGKTGIDNYWTWSTFRMFCSIYIYIYMFVILVSMEWEGHVFVAVSLWPKAYFGRRLSAAEDGTLPFSRG